MKVLRFPDLELTVLPVTGSQLLQSPHARDRIFKGLNLPQQKACETRYSTLLRRLQAAEQQALGRPAAAARAEQPAPALVAACQVVALSRRVGAAVQAIFVVGRCARAA